ncbi:MAG: DUF3530 family protein [Gammaproteobacteria bacterium]|nr:MAG: DUF3530 family protein [Gammaproteobacteria bacterium]
MLNRQRRFLLLLLALFTGLCEGVSGDEQARSAVYTGVGQQSLAERFPDAARWLELENDGRALGLMFPEQDPPAAGAALILADVGETAASGLAGDLGRHLAERGWAALTLGMEAPGPGLQRLLEQPVVASDAGDEAKSDGGEQGGSSVMIDMMDESGTGNDPLERHYAHVRKLVEAGLADLAGQGYQKIALVGVGHACNYLVDEAWEGTEPVGLIWVEPAFYPAQKLAVAERRKAANGLQVLELELSGEAMASRIAAWLTRTSTSG